MQAEPYRTADGRGFATLAERDAYLQRQAAIEDEIYLVELERQRRAAGSLSAQQAARREAQRGRLAFEDTLAEQRLRAARRAERAARRRAEIQRREAGLQGDRLERQRREARQRNAELDEDRARREARRAERRAQRTAQERERLDAEERAARRAERRAQRQAVERDRLAAEDRAARRAQRRADRLAAEQARIDADTRAVSLFPEEDVFFSGTEAQREAARHYARQQELERLMRNGNASQADLREYNRLVGPQDGE